MNYPDRRFLSLTWVGWLNFLLVQWLCVRIAGRIDHSGKFAGWGLRGPVLPLSGWWGDYLPRRPRWLMGKRP